MTNSPDIFGAGKESECVKSQLQNMLKIIAGVAKTDLVHPLVMTIDKRA